MADEGRYSRVTRRVWNDERFRELSAAKPNAQTLWMRLLTGPELGVIPGLFAAREAGLADALGWPLAGFRRCWKEIEGKGMASADWKAGLVWVHNATSHNPPANPNIVKGWRSALVELPECDVKRRAVSSITEWLNGLGNGLGNGFANPSVKGSGKGSDNGSANGSDNGFPKGLANQDQDQEQESQHAAALRTDQQTRASVVEKLLESQELSAEDVYREWHAAGPPGTLHHLGSWREHYWSIAETINRHPKVRPQNRPRVLAKLCLWVWRDPEGPHGSGRLTRITPDKIAKRCATDIDSAVNSNWIDQQVGAPPAEASA